MKILRQIAFILLLSGLALGQANPVPFVNQPLVPMTVAPGSGAFTLTVNGTGFVSGEVVNWNGNPLATTFINQSQLTAEVPAVNVAANGSAWVTVTNPLAGGAVSNTQYLEIGPAATPAFATFPYPFGSLSNAAYATTTFDFNGDGNLDLMIGFYNPANVDDVGGVQAFLGQSDGSFTLSSDGPGYDGALGLVPGDFNGDSKTDLGGTVANIPPYTPSSFCVTPGNPEANFATSICSNTSSFPGPVFAADINKDGKLDMVSTKQGLYIVAIGNGDGTFSVQSSTSFQNVTTLFPTTADFNGDGNLDLVGYEPLLMGSTVQGLTIAFGNGDGTFQQPTQYFATAYDPAGCGCGCERRWKARLNHD